MCTVMENHVMMILFCFPPQVMLKIYLSFLFNITAPQKLNKKVSFHVISYSSLLVMISSSFISCMYKLFFARKKIYNFTSSSVNQMCLLSFLWNNLMIKIKSTFISSQFLCVKLRMEI